MLNDTQPYIYAASNLAAGLSDAYQQLNKLPAGALNVIVLFTGGIPNAITADFSSLVSAAAGCSVVANPLKGVLWSSPPLGFSINFNALQVGGLSDPTAQSIDDPLELREAPEAGGCSGLAPTRLWGTYNNLTGLPLVDAYGNSTGINSASAFTSMPNATVNGDNLPAAAANALDDAANTIRTSTVAPLIYTIALFGLPDTQPNAALMARVANDANLSNNYQSAQPAGTYFAVPSIDQLAGVFKKVASQVVSLAQ
jgi:hypothetical protein